MLSDRDATYCEKADNFNKTWNFKLNHAMTLIGYDVGDWPRGWPNYYYEYREVPWCRSRHFSKSCFEDEVEWNAGDHSLSCCKTEWINTIRTKKDYWILQNSWGENWGMNGMIHVKVGEGKGWCGMNMDPYEMIVHTYNRFDHN